jgi:hypothetical protein
MIAARADLENNAVWVIDRVIADEDCGVRVSTAGDMLDEEAFALLFATSRSKCTMVESSAFLLGISELPWWRRPSGGYFMASVPRITATNISIQRMKWRPRTYSSRISSKVPCSRPDRTPCTPGPVPITIFSSTRSASPRVQDTRETAHGPCPPSRSPMTFSADPPTLERCDLTL